MIRNALPKQLWRDDTVGARRRGSFMTLGLFCLIVCMTFVAFSVDVGMISLTHTRMQNSVDAAALAAAMEITYAIENADEDVDDVLIYAKTQASNVAVAVADTNGVYVDPQTDVVFGHRTYNESSGEYDIAWGQDPPNCVKVIARKDNDDLTAPDAKMQMLFAGVGGDQFATVRSVAVAYVESRDIVTILDFSRSMNFDSYFADEFEDPASQLPQAEIENNLLTVWQDLGSPAFGSMPWTPDWVTVPTSDNHLEAKWMSDSVTCRAIDYNDGTNDFQAVKLYFSNGSSQTFTPTSQEETYSGTGGNAGQRITRVDFQDWGNWKTVDFYNNDDIKRGLGLNGVSYPYSVGSWSNYIEMARDHSSSMTNYYESEIYAKGYRRKFGIMTFIHYLLKYESGHWETADLWKTRHYPFHSVKEGEQLFCDFLENLNFSDHVGLVSYDSSHRVEQTLSGAGMPTVDISDDPLTDDYQAIRDIIEHKQAAHYSYATNMGGGLKDAKWLIDNYKRIGSRPTILLMTDGNTNTIDSGESTSLPAGWNWDELFDYDGDGIRDYETSSSQFRYALIQAKQAADAGIMIHTLSVGSDANTDLMRAISHLGDGIAIVVPGSTSVSQMQAEIEEAFRQIAAMVPPAKLLNPAE